MQGQFFMQFCKFFIILVKIRAKKMLTRAGPYESIQKNMLVRVGFCKSVRKRAEPFKMQS